MDDHMEGGPRSPGSVMAFGAALWLEITMKSVPSGNGAFSVNSSDSVKGDSATRFSWSQLVPDFETFALPLTSTAVSVW